MMLLLVFAASAAASVSAPPPPAKMVAKIERAVRLPPGTARLEAYERYYAYGRDDGSPATTDVVTGVYLRAKTGRGAAHPVTPPDLPLVMDGGCDVVTVVWDVKTKAVVRARCNGES